MDAVQVCIDLNLEAHFVFPEAQAGLDLEATLLLHGALLLPAYICSQELGDDYIPR